jgi:hypothetical protein
VRFRVKYLDGTETEVVRTASALRAFEREHDRPLVSVLATGVSWWADELAYLSLVQRGDVEPDVDLETWLLLVETITWGAPAERLEAIAEVMGMHVSSDPTAGASDETSSTGNSSTSPSPRASRSKRSSS